MARILVVDDDEMIRKTVIASLQQAGHTVIVTEDGREAADKFSDCALDLVITDILMPEWDGLELIAWLRSRGSTIKILAMSGGGRTRSMEFLPTAASFGATATIKKPFTHDQFVSKVTELLR